MIVSRFSSDYTLFSFWLPPCQLAAALAVLDAMSTCQPSLALSLSDICHMTVVKRDATLASRFTCLSLLVKQCIALSRLVFWLKKGCIRLCHLAECAWCGFLHFVDMIDHHRDHFHITITVVELVACQRPR